MSGSTVVWTERLTRYPSGLWLLSYHLRGAAALDVNAEGNDDDSHTITLLAATGMTPTPLPTGQYFYQAYATDLSNSTDKRLVHSSRVQILPDLSSTGITTYDGRSVAELMVEAIDNVLAKKATRDQESYTIGQRTLKRIPPDQLISWRKYYAGLVQGEKIQARIEAGGSPFETIAVEFVPPGRGSN